jgi:hypothetical protein
MHGGHDLSITIRGVLQPAAKAKSAIPSDHDVRRDTTSLHFDIVA